jgi:nuclear transport factor 2 (NTF2) superfamily protein
MKAGRVEYARARERNEKLFEKYLKGYTYRELADLFAISHNRVMQIVQREVSRRAGQSYAQSGILQKDRDLKRHRDAMRAASQKTGLSHQTISRVLRAYLGAMSA